MALFQRALEIIKTGENFGGLQIRNAQVFILVDLSVDAHASCPATDIPARIKSDNPTASCFRLDGKGKLAKYFRYDFSACNETCLEMKEKSNLLSKCLRHDFGTINMWCGERDGDCRYDWQTAQTSEQIKRSDVLGQMLYLNETQAIK